MKLQCSNANDELFLQETLKVIARLRARAAVKGISWIWLDKVFYQTLESFPTLFKNRYCPIIDHHHHHLTITLSGYKARYRYSPSPCHTVTSSHCCLTPWSKTQCCSFIFCSSPDNVPVKSKLQHPPRQLPGHLNFWKIFVQIPPSLGQKTVHMPPPLGKLPDYCLNFSDTLTCHKPSFQR